MVSVCIGDSITAGAAATVPFPIILANLTGDTVRNKGINGNTTTKMLARFDDDVVAQTPSRVVILWGHNDIVGSTPAATIVSNLTAMCDAAVTAGIEPFLSTILPCVNFTDAQDLILDEANAGILSYCTANDIQLLDLGCLLADPGDDHALDTEYTADGTHPNDTGHLLIGNYIYECWSYVPNVWNSLRPAPDTGSIDRSSVDRWDNSECKIGVNIGVTE
jgi:lysophospholipase L1-like esterase